jgi:hypothetical protein
MEVKQARMKPQGRKNRGASPMSSFPPAPWARLPSFAVLVLLCLMSPLTQGEGNSHNWSIKGFGTFGVSGTDTDRLEFRRDTSQTDGVTRSGGIDIDSRLGVQLDGDLSESLHTTVQWVARQHDSNFFEQNLDWAFLGWRPRSDLDIRVGRLGFDVFMLSDYRNVGYAYPWIRPPHEFYAGLSPYHFDGADLAKKFEVGEGFLTVKGFAGYSFNQLPAGFSTTFDSGLVVAGGNLVYEIGNWRARLGYVYSQTRTELPVQPVYAALRNPQVNAVWPGANALIKDISTLGGAVNFGSIGLAYDDGIWLAQMEGAYSDSNLHVYPTVANGYFSLGRRFGSVTLFTLLGIAETLNRHVEVSQPLLPVPQVVSLRDSVDTLLNNNGVDEKSVSLGVRWDVRENIALKAQWSHYWLGQNGTQLWVEPASGPTPANVNVWSLGVDFLF